MSTPVHPYSLVGQPIGSVQVPGFTILEEIVGHLGAAIKQMQPNHDQIIAEHIRIAHELAGILWRAS